MLYVDVRGFNSIKECIVNRRRKATLEDAIALATIAHKGQKDKLGRPYILHPLRVMLKVDNPVDEIVAALHDVLEDTKTTADDFRKAGISEEAIAAVDALTKRKGEDYDKYLVRVKRNKIATRVKFADLQDNSDPDRLSQFPVKERERLKKKYDSAYEFLTKTTN
jgi:(p)ppGpp synthase/HD superfamily hydrolase